MSDCVHDTSTFRCVEYVRNYDADTLTVNIPGVPPLIGKEIGVRVAQIDSPEIRGKNPCEKEAARAGKKMVESLLKKARRIDLLNVERDKYFRILADVSIDGQDLKHLLLKNHLAQTYDGGTKKKADWCRQPASR